MASGIFAAFTGVLWAARTLGVPRGVATTAVLAYVACPQYLGKLYTRGAWAEFVAVSMATLLAGSVLRSLPADGARPTRGALVCVALSTALVAGTHNITFALAIPFVALIAAARAWSLHRRVRATLRSLAVPGIAVLAGIGFTAVFTVPNIALSRSTAITSWNYLDTVPEWNTPSAVLQPHATGSITRVNETSSLLLIAIAILGISWIASRRRASHSTDRLDPVAGAASLVAIGLLVLTTCGSLWSDTSSILHRLTPYWMVRTIQFPSRLTAFLTLSLILLLFALWRSARGDQARRLATVVVLAAATWYGATGLVFVATVDRSQAADTSPISRRDVRAGSAPSSFAPGQQTQFLLTESGEPIDRPAAAISFDANGRAADTIAVRPGQLLATNVAWSPLITARGAIIEGRDVTGMAVLRVTSDSFADVRVVSDRPPVVVLGAAVSCASAIAAAWWLVRRPRT